MTNAHFVTIAPMIRIGGSVGAQPAANLRNDVVAVQGLLNVHLGRLGIAALQADGQCGNKTISAIREFQRRVVLMPHPDGRVDPGGHTLSKLSATGAPQVLAPAAIITLTGLKLPIPAEKVLKAILHSAGLTTAQVTSVTRTAADQARIMYENIVAHDVKFSYKLYSSDGDKVTKVYEDNQGKPKATVLALMEAKINEIGPSKVSKHCSSTHYVFDVAPSSITAKDGFIKAVKGHKAVSKLLQPPDDPAYHLEIPKDSPFL
jgi:hypothetical protein